MKRGTIDISDIKKGATDIDKVYRATELIWERGTPSDPDATAFLNAAGITDPTISSAVNTLTIGLKNGGIWNKISILYPFVGGTTDTHKWNLKDPRDLDAAYRITWGGTVIHDSKGIGNNSNVGYANTHMIPASDPNFNGEETNLATSFYMADPIGSASTAIFGTIYSSGSRWNFSPNWIDNGFDGDMFHSNTARGRVQLDPAVPGLYTQIRTGASSGNNVKLFVNGNKEVDYVTTFNPDVVNIDKPFLLLMVQYDNGNIGNPGPQVYSFFMVSEDLSDAEAVSLNTLVSAFQTTLGRNV